MAKKVRELTIAEKMAKVMDLRPIDDVFFEVLAKEPGVLQEMLTNGVKHGNATEFVVILSGDSAHIRLESKDNGRSDFTAENSGARIEKGFGVKKIISYAERCGGKTSFTNEDGFRAMVELPIIDLERNGLKNV